jgi:hypothetical protein
MTSSRSGPAEEAVGAIPRAGLISPATAASVYGVVLAGGYSAVDEAATAALRESMRLKLIGA